MPPDLKPLEALSQVVFVHDYIQLVFQDEVFNIYNIPELVHQGASVDALVGLIGQRVISVSRTEPEMLLLDFERGARFRLPSGDEGVRGPEAFQFRGQNNSLVIEQNV